MYLKETSIKSVTQRILFTRINIRTRNMHKLEDSFDIETKVIEREYLIKIKEEIIRVTRGRLLRVKIRLVSRRMRKYLRFYTVANLANDHCA